MRLFFVLIILAYQPLSFAKKKRAFDGYESKVEVPEPLFIDLVRSLSAEKGEYEFNSLFFHSQGDYGELKWAPEVEFVLAEGTAIEFELPSEGGTLKNYKVAVQKRVHQNRSRSQLHGLQAIYEADTRFLQSEATIFYVLASRMSHKFSTVGLHGFKTALESYEGLELMLNQTLFYNYSQEIDFGLEYNYSSGALGLSFWQLVPQLHLAFEEGAKIQFGFGGRQGHGSFAPVATFRLIFEFNN